MAAAGAPLASRRRLGTSVAWLARLSAYAAVAGSLARGDDLVCELLMPANEPLQDAVGVNCTVDNANGTCSCTSEWGKVFNQTTWHFITSEVNSSIQACEPGFWYLTDSSGQCGASFGLDAEPTKLGCPPGFYCAGGRDPPKSCSSGDYCPAQTKADGRRCPAGYFCPFPAAPLQDCMEGGFCDEGSTQPTACVAGYYCTGGQAQLCPKGSYCPQACSKPVACQFLKFCPVGSAHQNSILIAAFALLSCIVAMLLGAQYYRWFADDGYKVCALLLVAIVVMALVDPVIAGFLSLYCVGIAVNYMLLQLGLFRSVGPRVLMFITFCTGLAILWAVNPAWSLLCAGLLLFFLVGYLMSRESPEAVLAGRAALVVLYFGLIVAAAHVDPTFLVASVIMYATWLLCEWLYAMRHRLPSLWQGRPLARHFGQDDASTCSSEVPVLRLPSASSTGGSFMFALSTVSPREWSARMSMRRSTAGPAPSVSPAALLPPGDDSELAASFGSSSSSSGRRRRAGVSFQLQDVGFQLPDGRQLLSHISLSIAPGRRVAVMGPSGSGKTTLLFVLSGRASYGQVLGTLLVNGERASDLRLLRHVTGFVPQDDVLHGELTVEENIRFQAKLRLPDATTEEQIEKQVTQVAEDLHLAAVRKSRIGTAEERGVSGGQRKRASIAMELVAQPLLLFADEPTSGLDSTTAHEVITCLNDAAHRLGTTVIAVIHQPRYETLLLFDDLVLLATGGSLVYAGPTTMAKEGFEQHLRVEFPPDANPADIMLDAIQPRHRPSDQCIAALCAWGAENAPELPHQLAGGADSRAAFVREIPPFFRMVLIFMDRAMLQTMRAYTVIVISQVLSALVTVGLCNVLKNDRIENFMMQSCLATLFLMLLQGVAAQRIFGADLLVTLREARVGMNMIAFLVAKDLASLFEITLSAVVFASTYGSFSGVQQPVRGMFAGAWAFVYCTYGMSYIFSILLSPGAAQMSSVVAAFVSFCVSGVYSPQLPTMADYFGGRGWMIPALSPVRWFWGYLLTAEMRFLTPLSRQYGAGALQWRGYDLKYLDGCSLDGLDIEGTGFISLWQAWTNNRGWVCSNVHMLLLGIIFRFLAGVCLVLHLHAQRWKEFFGESEAGWWKLLGKFLVFLVVSFLVLFLLAEVWIFGIQGLDVRLLLKHLGWI